MVIVVVSLLINPDRGSFESFKSVFQMKIAQGITDINSFKNGSKVENV